MKDVRFYEKANNYFIRICFGVPCILSILLLHATDIKTQLDDNMVQFILNEN